MQKVILGCVLLMSLGVFAQDKPKVKNPVVPDKTALSLRAAQVNMLGARLQVTQDEKAVETATGTLNVAIAKAYAEAGLKDTEYSIDTDKWEFVPIPKTPVPPPK